MKTFKLQSIRQLKIISLLISTIVFIQCVGPEGPMGPQGNDGLNGIDGTAFAYSVIYDIYTNEWDGNADGYTAILDVPEITDDIYYNGAVLVYRLIETEPKSFNLLPYTYVDNGFMIYMDFDVYIGEIDLIYKEITDGINDTYPPANTMSFKVMIIEGIPLAKLKTMVDIRDFNAVSGLIREDNIQGKEVR